MTFTENKSIINPSGKPVAKVHYESSIKDQYKDTLREPLHTPELSSESLDFDINKVNNYVLSLIDTEFIKFLPKKIEYNDVVETTGSAAIGGRHIILLNENWKDPKWREKYYNEWSSKPWEKAKTSSHNGTIEGVLLHEYGHTVLHEITNKIYGGR